MRRNPSRQAGVALVLVIWLATLVALRQVLTSAAARTRIPHRVRFNSHHRTMRMSGPVAMRKRSYSGTARPAIMTEPSSPGALGPGRSSAPQIASAASLMMRTRANVASNCNRSWAP